MESRFDIFGPRNIRFKQPEDSDLVKRIRAKVGDPAQFGMQVSRDDLELKDERIHLDIGGGGR